MKPLTEKQIRSVRLSSLPSLAEMVDKGVLKIQALNEQLSELKFEFQQAVMDLRATSGVLAGELNEFITKKADHVEKNSPVRNGRQKVQGTKAHRKNKGASRMGVRRGLVRNPAK